MVCFHSFFFWLSIKSILMLVETAKHDYLLGVQEVLGGQQRGQFQHQMYVFRWLSCSANTIGLPSPPWPLEEWLWEVGIQPFFFLAFQCITFEFSTIISFSMLTVLHADSLIVYGLFERHKIGTFLQREKSCAAHRPRILAAERHASFISGSLPFLPFLELVPTCTSEQIPTDLSIMLCLWQQFFTSIFLTC